MLPPTNENIRWSLIPILGMDLKVQVSWTTTRYTSGSAPRGKGCYQKSLWSAPEFKSYVSWSRKNISEFSPTAFFPNPFFAIRRAFRIHLWGCPLRTSSTLATFPNFHNGISICRTSKLSVISGWKYASRQERGHGSGNMEIVGNIGSPRKRPPPAAGIPLRDLLVLPAPP